MPVITNADRTWIDTLTELARAYDDARAAYARATHNWRDLAEARDAAKAKLDAHAAT